MSDEKVSENTSIDDLKQAGISSKLSDAQKAFLALKTTLDEEAINLIQEREAFESVRKKIDSVHFSKHIKLNVGGQVFKTSIDTLLKDPDSMLASMFSERFDVKPDKEDGAYFIDRDGTHFRLILNYLRTGELNYPKGNKIMAKELFLEAEFYQLIDIQKEVWPEIAFQKSSYIINTLNEEQKDALLSWLPTKSNFVSWVQLYSSVNHGWWSSSFHQRCDNQGPTVIIARSGNYIFGGYAEVPWKSDSSFVNDVNAFLFTLANPTGAPPTKLAQTPGGNTGIYCHPSYGPTFGVSGTCGVYFMNGANTSNCGMNNSYIGFVVPGGQVFSNFIYGNTTSFGMSHLEVFGLKEK